MAGLAALDLTARGPCGLSPLFHYACKATRVAQQVVSLLGRRFGGWCVVFWGLVPLLECNLYSNSLLTRSR